MSGFEGGASSDAAFITVINEDGLSMERKLEGIGGITVTDNGPNSTLDIDGSGITSNTLDGAYDEGGSGVGRTITVDAGPVVLSSGAAPALLIGDGLLFATPAIGFVSSTNTGFARAADGSIRFVVSGAQKIAIGGTGGPLRVINAMAADLQVSSNFILAGASTVPGTAAAPLYRFVRSGGVGSTTGFFRLGNAVDGIGMSVGGVERARLNLVGALGVGDFSGGDPISGIEIDKDAGGTDKGYLTMKELLAAPAGVADKAQVFPEDNGAGKTRLMVQFPTGAAQQLAIEP